MLIELFQPTLNVAAVQAVYASDQALAILADANAPFSQRTICVESADCLALAYSHGCSSYDAEFVVLARQLGCPLLTFDRRLLQLFRDVAVKPGS